MVATSRQFSDMQFVVYHAGWTPQHIGHPALTDAIKAKVLGLNAARLRGLDPQAASLDTHVTGCGASGRRMARLMQAIAPG
jgi:hypothetical protein